MGLITSFTFSRSQIVALLVDTSYEGRLLLQSPTKRRAGTTIADDAAPCIRPCNVMRAFNMAVAAGGRSLNFHRASWNIQSVQGTENFEIEPGGSCIVYSSTKQSAVAATGAVAHPEWRSFKPQLRAPVVSGDLTRNSGGLRAAVRMRRGKIPQ